MGQETDQWGQTVHFDKELDVIIGATGNVGNGPGGFELQSNKLLSGNTHFGVKVRRVNYLF